MMNCKRTALTFLVGFYCNNFPVSKLTGIDSSHRMGKSWAGLTHYFSAHFENNKWNGKTNTFTNIFILILELTPEKLRRSIAYITRFVYLNMLDACENMYQFASNSEK